MLKSKYSSYCTCSLQTFNMCECLFFVVDPTYAFQTLSAISPFIANFW